MDSIRTETLAQAIAWRITAIENCRKSGNADWTGKHSAALESLQRILPSGAGFDAGSKIDLDKSDSGRIVITTEFHHMNDGGCYDGWTDHVITVRPDWQGVSISVSGRNRNEIKDYIAEMFGCAMRDVIGYDQDGMPFSVRMRQQAESWKAAQPA